MNKIGLRVQQGFTLIELVIVLVLLGILVAVAIPKYQDFSTDATDAAAFASAGALNSAYSIAVAANGGAPTVAQFLAQIQGASQVGNNFEVTLANGTTVTVPATYSAASACTSTSGTTNTYVCSINVNGTTHN